MLEAKTPKPALQVEGDDARMDNRYPSFFLCYKETLSCGGCANVCRMLKDDRVHMPEEKSIFNFRDLSDRMG